MSEAFAPALYAVYSNPLPGREDDLHAWYEEVHIPDSLGHGLFDSVRRYRATAGGRARFLTLWGCRYGSEDEALAAVRPVAEKLRAEGRIEVVQEVVFQQFVFLEGVLRARENDEAQHLTTLHSAWSDPASVARFDAWLAAQGDQGLLGVGAVARYGVPAPRRKALVLVESPHDDVAAAETAEPELPPFGEPTPIFEGGSPAPSPERDATVEAARVAAARPAWAARWSLVSSR